MPSGDANGSRRGLFSDPRGDRPARRPSGRAVLQRGRRHAGENLGVGAGRTAPRSCRCRSRCAMPSSAQPAGRAADRSRAHCLAHARRRFVDVYDRFPEVCRHLLESLAVVYRNDAAEARERGLTPEARLRFHQEASGPDDAVLRDWLERHLGEKRTELQFAPRRRDRLHASAEALGGAVAVPAPGGCPRWTTTCASVL